MRTKEVRGGGGKVWRDTVRGLGRRRCVVHHPCSKRPNTPTDRRLRAYSRQGEHDLSEPHGEMLERAIESVKASSSHALFGSAHAVHPIDEALMPDRKCELGESRKIQLITSKKYTDDCLLSALENHPDINQVVLLSIGLDTRPFRLLFPSGTVMFDLSPSPLMDYKLGRLKGKRICSGSLCRHIGLPLGGAVGDILRRNGYQASKKSIWVMQDMDLYCGTEGKQMEEVLSPISKQMSMGSLLIGTASGMGCTQVKNFLAKITMHGQCLDLAGVLKLYGEEGLTHTNQASAFFCGTQLSRSSAEREIYEAHVELAEEIDEDYFDNFS
eukprot:CAMPEP_0198234484 /NCGR_PEP_ID=MMETSP1446-20131203/498_1 /TAXON_ID=1461542 ORGANISM="Unidentified sp, Strain CCMP2111" /NCGR_SAMPLE_ID=MMETSP1446 /ASSEMBLY_ACC=CAM_ASM_001112 /LENGTH=326 /DNA_ID=CAMNT_0043915275 /DNA_START=125 /DNA_END=1105 /DNA_ORIENTATION=+